jgi:metal-responsive CopG/Arc/MetJ family transcriptional regulator
MTIQVDLPDELIARIDGVAEDRTAFIADAVRVALVQSRRATDDQEVARINDLAEELNREASEVLEYQVFS